MHSQKSRCSIQESMIRTRGKGRERADLLRRENLHLKWYSIHSGFSKFFDNLNLNYMAKTCIYTDLGHSDLLAVRVHCSIRSTNPFKSIGLNNEKKTQSGAEPQKN